VRLPIAEKAFENNGRSSTLAKVGAVIIAARDGTTATGRRPDRSIFGTTISHLAGAAVSASGARVISDVARSLISSGRNPAVNDDHVTAKRKYLVRSATAGLGLGPIIFTGSTKDNGF